MNFISVKYKNKKIKIFSFLYLLFKILLIEYIIKIKLINIVNKKSLLNKFMLTKELIIIYTNLYDSYRNGYFKPKFLNNTNISYPIKQKKKGICICSIGKNENLYIREFVEYYYLIGVDKIIIYDNNDIDGENFDEILEDFIKKRLVEIIDVRGLLSIQIPIYNYCYHKYKDLYDWIGFLDIDEFLYIKNNNNIKRYFYNKNFKNCETIYFNWLMYNDNNKIKYDNRELQKRFLIPFSYFSCGKSFVRGGFNNLLIPTTMIPGINIHYFCNSNGEKIYPNNFYKNKIEKNPKAYIKHYYSKTVEEFCIKLKKGDAHYNNKNNNRNGATKRRIRLFFYLNKKTEQKIRILKNCTGIDIKKIIKI